MNILTAARRATLGAILALSATMIPAHSEPLCTNDVAGYRQNLEAAGYHFVATGTTHDGLSILLALGGKGLWVLLAQDGEGICFISSGKGALAISIPGSPA